MYRVARARHRSRVFQRRGARVSAVSFCDIFFPRAQQKSYIYILCVRKGFSSIKKRLYIFAARCMYRRRILSKHQVLEKKNASTKKRNSSPSVSGVRRAHNKYLLAQGFFFWSVQHSLCGSRLIEHIDM